MTRLLRHVALWTLVLSAALHCRADRTHLYTPDKLSSGLITCICQDRYGYVWIGTEYGLNKFDGYRYTAYHHDRQDTTTISDNEIATLYVDSDGQLWVGGSKGLSRYDYEHDRFQRYHFPDDRQPRISALTRRPDGYLLIGTAGYGLYTLQPGTSHIHYESAFNRRRLDAFYSRMFLDREGCLWRSSHVTTLTRYSMTDGRLTSLRDYESTAGIPMRYLEYDDRQMLIVCMHGILSYDYKSHELRDAGFDLSLLDRNIAIEDATVDHQGHLYIGTSGSGLMVIPKGDRRLQRVETTSPRIDLTTANVVDIMEDKDHHLWVACYNKGLLLISQQQAAFSSWSFSDQHFVTGGNISSIAPGDGDDIWCTVQNNGVYHLDGNGHITDHPASPPGTRIIYRDHGGQYWLTTENTLYRYDPHTGKATQEQTFDGRGLNCMTDDGQGHLYLCVYGMGLCVYHTATREARLLSMQQNRRSGGYLCNDWIKAMTFDSRGMLWICTTNGLSMMDPDGYVFNSRGWNALLEDQQCFAVCETADGDMLIGTETGLYRYSWQRNQVVEEPKATMLRDKMICSIVRDNQGDVWFSSTQGIWQYSHQRQQMIGHIGGNGLRSKEYIMGAALHTPDDRIFFGTADGITAFRPKDINSREQKPGKVFLTRFVSSGRSLNVRETRFELPFSDNQLTLDFSLLDYQGIGNIAFQYRLNGSRTWQQTSDGVNQLTFPQLQPGRYTLDVRATANGQPSDAVTTLYIHILPPWYQTWWARLLCLLLAVVIGGLALFSWRSYQKEKRLHLTISSLRENMRWLRGKFFGSLEQQGELTPVQVKGNDDLLMERVVHSINENLSNPDFSVEQLTHDVGISRAQLHRKMKELTGLTTSEFIRNLRMEQAARLIKEKKVNITQVAYSVGFNNQTHFSTVFKRHFGIIPSEYADRADDGDTSKQQTTKQL